MKTPSTSAVHLASLLVREYSSLAYVDHRLQPVFYTGAISSLDRAEEAWLLAYIETRLKMWYFGCYQLLIVSDLFCCDS